MQLVAEPERVQQQEQVHLADAELDVATVGRLPPAQQPAVAEVVGLLVGREHAELVDPAAEVRATRSRRATVVTIRSADAVDVGRGRVRSRPNASWVDTASRPRGCRRQLGTGERPAVAGPARC